MSMFSSMANAGKGAYARLRCSADCSHQFSIRDALTLTGRKHHKRRVQNVLGVLEHRVSWSLKYSTQDDVLAC